MSNARWTSVIVGIVFIIATVAALLAAAAGPLPDDSSGISGLSSNKNQIFISAIMYIVAAFTSAGIAILMYPLLKPLNGTLALGAVVFRTIEAVFYMIGIVGLLTLATLNQNVPGLPENQKVIFQGLVSFIMKLREHATLLGVISFCIGALMYYWIFVRAHLVPYWLSVWGIIAALLMLTACGLSLFSDSPITGFTILVIPVAVQEMVLATWLIVKGFNEQKAAS